MCACILATEDVFLRRSLQVSVGSGCIPPRSLMPTVLMVYLPTRRCKMYKLTSPSLFSSMEYVCVQEDCVFPGCHLNNEIFYTESHERYYSGHTSSSYATGGRSSFLFCSVSLVG